MPARREMMLIFGIGFTLWSVGNAVDRLLATIAFAEAYFDETFDPDCRKVLLVVTALTISYSRAFRSILLTAWTVLVFECCGDVIGATVVLGHEWRLIAFVIIIAGTITKYHDMTGVSSQIVVAAPPPIVIPDQVIIAPPIVIPKQEVVPAPIAQSEEESEQTSHNPSSKSKNIGSDDTAQDVHSQLLEVSHSSVLRRPHPPPRIVKEVTLVNDKVVAVKKISIPPSAMLQQMNSVLVEEKGQLPPRAVPVERPQAPHQPAEREVQ